MTKADATAAEMAARHVLLLVPRLHRWVERTVESDDHSHVTLAQFLVLRRLCAAAASPGEIAHYLQTTPAVATGIIDRLERNQYVRRATRPGDRRRIYIEPTESGRQVSESSERRIAAALAGILQKYSTDDVQAVERAASVLGRVAVAGNLVDASR